MNSESPVTLVIVGISGDLASRKLLPALYTMEASKRLNDNFSVIGTSRREVKTEDLLAKIHQWVPQADEETISRLRNRLNLVRIDAGNPSDHNQLEQLFLKHEQGHAGARIFYLSVPPAVAMPVIDALRTSGLSSEVESTRLLVEKPFGYNLESAIELEEHLKSCLTEEKIYRIDHYMAKKAAFHIPDILLKDRYYTLMKRDHVESIDITIKEAIGIEGRTEFYEQTGALRDIIQNHALDILATVMMDRAGDGSTIHDARRALLESLRVTSSARGQYRGYRQEVQNPQSNTETMAVLGLESGAERWQGVPLRVATGKKLDERRTEVRIKFKDEPSPMVFRLFPDEAAQFTSQANKELNLNHSYDDPNQPGGYEKLLVDAVEGNRSIFMSGPEVLATWKIVDPVVEQWSRNADALEIYDPGAAIPEIGVKL